MDEWTRPMSDPPHARAFDLPGWPCPSRVRDIAGRENSWGWVPCDIGHAGSAARIAQDDLGYLWADGSAIPAFRVKDHTIRAAGAVLFWTESGLGVYVYPDSLPFIGSISLLDMELDRWVPIAVAAADLPEFVKA